MKGHPGSVYGTSDADILTAGKPVRVYGLTITSGAGGGGVALLKNGGSGGNTYFAQTGTASLSISWDYGVYGRLFPDGLYIDVDANVDSYVISCEQEA